MILPDHAHLGVVIPRLIIINMAYQGTEFEGYGSNCFKNITEVAQRKNGRFVVHWCQCHRSWHHSTRVAISLPLIMSLSCTVSVA